MPSGITAVSRLVTHEVTISAAIAQQAAKAGVTPDRAAMFEDDARNLAVPHAMGMRTVHVAPMAALGEHVHFHTNNLAGFLSQLV